MWVRWAWLTLLSTWKLPDATCSSPTNEYFILTLSPSRVVNYNRALLLSSCLSGKRTCGVFVVFFFPFFFFYHTLQYIQTVLPCFCIHREWTNRDEFLSGTSSTDVCINRKDPRALPWGMERSSALPCPPCSGTFTWGHRLPEHLPSKHSIFWSDVNLMRSYPCKYNNRAVFYIEMPRTPVMYPTTHLNSQSSSTDYPNIMPLRDIITVPLHVWWFKFTFTSYCVISPPTCHTDI